MTALTDSFLHHLTVFVLGGTVTLLMLLAILVAARVIDTHRARNRQRQTDRCRQVLDQLLAAPPTSAEMARRWIRALPLHGLPRGAARGLLVQGPWVLSVLWRASHVRVRGAPRGTRLARGARATGGAHPAATHPLRLAWRHDLCTAVAGVLLRALHRHLRPWAQTRRLGEARSGAIIVVQRFGGALNLNVHLHALVLDGVFARAGDGQLGFHRAPPPGVSGRRPLRLGYGEGRMLEGASGLNQALAWNAPDFKAVILSAQMRLVCHII